MRKMVIRICASAIALMLLTACSNLSLAGSEPEEDQSTEEEKNSSPALPDEILDSYYKAQGTPVYQYLQNSRLQKFFTMWVKEDTGGMEDLQWNYDSLTDISIVDYDLSAIQPDRMLYCLTFSGGNDRYGYFIVEYHETGPSVSNYGAIETTPYQYDLRANIGEISAALAETDIDLSTATASRLYLFDRENKRADQVILFTDGKGNKYICYFGDPEFEIEKW